jgi:hypothetical protein
MFVYVSSHAWYRACFWYIRLEIIMWRNELWSPSLCNFLHAATMAGIETGSKRKYHYYKMVKISMYLELVNISMGKESTVFT